ncbi:hypothetical protein FRB90_000851 [Tulasnella sp. 427]|nr:hypothetical protein FRB90_000851 [Tulasnella sp. 427]
MPPQEPTVDTDDEYWSDEEQPTERRPIDKGKGKARAVDIEEEEEAEEEYYPDGQEPEPERPAKERKRGMTLEEYFGPDIDLNQPLYKPHGKWAYTYGKDFNDVECVKRLSSGAQSEVWYNSAVVEGGERFDYIAKRWSVWAKWRGFFAEIYLYASSRHLRTLQGDIVPYFIGIHNVLGGYISFEMEPLDKTGWNEAHPRMPRHVKEMVMEAWKKLHAQGVLHNDVELRHMLINDARDKVMIIDFQESKSLYPCEDVGLKGCTQEDLDKEMQTVEELIDWDDYDALWRRRLNRAKRNFCRKVKRAQRAGEWEEPDWAWRAPSWYRDEEYEPSDDEPATDDEVADWERRQPEKDLIEYEVSEGETMGRRFNVPTDEEREKVRWLAAETERLLLEQRRQTLEMEKAKKAAEEAKTEGEATNSEGTDEKTTVNERAEATPAEAERPAVHFAEGTNESQADFEVPVMQFKKNDPPIVIENSTPGTATETEIHPPDPGTPKRRLISPPASPEPKSKKSKATAEGLRPPARSTRSKSPASVPDTSEGRVTRSMAKAAEADQSSPDEAGPSTRKTRSKSPAKRGSRKAAPKPVLTSSSSKSKRKRASSPKPPSSLAAGQEPLQNSKDIEAGAVPPKSPLPQQRPKRARKAKTNATE